MSFATPSTSPSKRLASHHNSSLETPPPIFKKQRLFSPDTPDTKSRSSKIWSHQSPSPCSFSLDSSTESNNEEAVRDEEGGYVHSDDVMMCSPPKIERLQLFDYPRTPLSIVKSLGLQMPGNCTTQTNQLKTVRRYVQ